MWCRASLALSLAVAAFGQVAVPALGQDVPQGSILTIDQERLFAETEFGKSVIRREEAAARALEAENARIEAELIAEEQELTDRRPTLSAEEFSALAAAFDAKVVRIRSAQDAKARELSRVRDTDRQDFVRTTIPVLGDLLIEKKAVAIIDKSAIILSLTAIDVTDAAVDKVDAALRARDGRDGALPDAEAPVAGNAGPDGSEGATPEPPDGAPPAAPGP
jgi:Skp family chaperone for outer membrane proteins